MSDEAALLTAIREYPDDDTPRLVYADWLDEHGDADRAEFIRTQCALSRLSHEDDRRTDLEVRELRLLAGHAAEWAAPRPVFPKLLPDDGQEEEKAYWSVFRRGFLEGVALDELSPEHMAPGGDIERLFAAHPIRELRLRSFQPGSLLALAKRPELGRVESLELKYFGRWNEGAAGQEREAEVETLLRSPRLERLRALKLTLFSSVTGAPARWLKLPAISRLRRLDVWPRAGEHGEYWKAWAAGACPDLSDIETSWGRSDEPRLASRFAASPACQRLVRLNLSLDLPISVSFPWDKILANAPLQQLHVSTPSGEEVPSLLRALGSVPATGALRGLRVWGFKTNDADVTDWLENGYAVGVRELAIHHGELTDDDLERLGKSPAAARLTRLTLGGNNNFTPRGVQAFLESPHLAGLRYLNLVGADLTAAGLHHIAQRGTLRGLRVLRMGGLIKRNKTDRPAIMNLVKGKPFPNLHTLLISFEDHLQPQAWRELLDSSKLPSLAVIRTGVPAGKQSAWKKFLPTTRLAWLGGSIWKGSECIGHGGIHPQNVYLPSHLDDFVDFHE
jgi:uncharacterized protein (TIGR02996 family)